MRPDRFDRNTRFFGATCQERLRQTKVTVIGVGGTGSHVVQQLAFLGVGHLTLVDPEELDLSNRNRYIGSLFSDLIPGTLKVNIAERLVNSIDPEIQVCKHPVSLLTGRGFEAVRESHAVFGCVDREGIRLVLAQLCAAYRKALFDIASDIEPGDHLRYGGRVCIAMHGDGCPLCLGQIDAAEAGVELASPDARDRRNEIYGLNPEVLGARGPSVVSINGAVASLAVTEFMLEFTGVRRAKHLLTYRADLGKVFVSTDSPSPDCFICKGIWGRGSEAELERQYLRN